MEMFVNSSLDRIIGVLKVCAQEPTARENVMSLFHYIYRHHVDGHNLTDIIHNMLAILDTCAKSGEVAEDKAAQAIFWLSGLLDLEVIDETLLNTFKKFSKEASPAYYISWTIKNMGERGTLNQCDPDKTRQIMDIFLSCSRRFESHLLSFHAKDLIKNDVLQRCRTDQIQSLYAKLIKNLKKHGEGISPVHNKNATEAINEMIKKDLLSEDNINIIYEFAKNPTCWDDKENAIQIIKTVVNNDNVVRKTPDRISKTVDVLAKILEGNFGNEYEVISIIRTMINRDMLSQCDKRAIQKIVALLINNLKINYARESAIIAIADIIKNNNVLNQLNNNKLEQLANSLPGDLANNNTQEAATIIISVMAEKPQMFNQFNNAQLHQILALFKTHLENYLTNRNYEMIDRIFKVLKKCSEIDDLKADVADIAKMLTYRDNFFQYLNQVSQTPILGNFLDILISCSSTQSADTRAKAVCAVSTVIRKINILIYTNMEIPDKIPQIIGMLEESSTVDEVKIHVADAIILLGQKNLLNNLAQVDVQHLFNAIDNCLTYGNERILAMKTVDTIQLINAATVNMIFGDHAWVASFIGHLSPNDTVRFFELADEARNAYEHAREFM